MFILHNKLSAPMKQLFGAKDPSASVMKKFTANIVSGGLAGIISMTVNYPIEFLRVRMAMEVGKTPKDRIFNSYKDIIKKVNKRNGLTGFYKGYPISILGIFIYRGSYFGLFDTFKHLAGDNIMVMWLFAQFITTGALFLAYPLATIKGRMMMQSAREKVQYKNSFHSIKTIFRKEGIRGFYGGLGVNLLTSAGGSVALICYEAFSRRSRE